MYQKVIKRWLDIICCGGAMIFLWPVFLIIAVLIKLDSKGPVYFKQKRVGIHKTHFYIYKFRTMRIDTPKDMPTHLLKDPDAYITRMGKFLRKTSLDELPQILHNVLINGDMSIIGPRPALWNQYDLIEERDKYGANDVKPGISGWAQIHGRDELEIPVKAELDGYYAQHIGFLMDVRCLLGSVKSVLKSEGVVEGGTGAMEMAAEAEHDTGIRCSGDADGKKIYILGENSYIGTSVENWLLKNEGKYQIITVDIQKTGFKEFQFKKDSCVFFVAGIAHQKETSENRKLYYRVNRDMPLQAARKARKEGGSQFIFMSSMSVFGQVTGIITPHSKKEPTTNYGKSKLQADRNLMKMNGENFRVCIIRPPMVYGNGCKGNYQLLRKLALKTPVFPSVKNKRSMIFIDNLCDYIQWLIDEERAGIYYPQNQKYVCTADMVKAIAEVHGKKILFIPVFNALIQKIKMPLIEKVFGNLVYRCPLKKANAVEDFYETIKLTEKVK